jgi:hemerythrin
MDMRLADWSDKLVFGIERVDAQHKQLFELAATFEGNGEQIRMMKTLALLCGYVKEHFREEEQLLESCGYPLLADHRKLHLQFKGMLYELLQNAKHMSLDDVANQVQYLINGWFYNHIMVTDLDYVPLVKSRMRNGAIRRADPT